MPLKWNPRENTALPITGKLRPHQRPVERTLLYAWLKAHQVSMKTLRDRVGCAPKMVDYWCNGQCIPSLPYAFQIEKVTDGGVPATSWLGTEMGRIAWNVIQTRVKNRNG